MQTCWPIVVWNQLLERADIHLGWLKDKPSAFTTDRIIMLRSIYIASPCFSYR